MFADEQRVAKISGTNSLAFIAKETSAPVIIGARIGEDPELIRAAFIRECKLCDTTLTGIQFFGGMEPRPEYMAEPPEPVAEPIVSREAVPQRVVDGPSIYRRGSSMTEKVTSPRNMARVGRLQTAGRSWRTRAYLSPR